MILAFVRFRIVGLHWARNVRVKEFFIFFVLRLFSWLLLINPTDDVFFNTSILFLPLIYVCFSAFISLLFGFYCFGLFGGRFNKYNRSSA